MDALIQPVLRLCGFHMQLSEALSETHNMALPTLLDGFNPALVGSYPVGLALEGSDLDYVCDAYDLEAFATTAIEAFGDLDNFTCEMKNMRGGASCVVTFESPNGYPVEIVAQPRPTGQNYGYLRMLVTARLVAFVGKSGQENLLKLKKGGASTDVALMTLFGIDEDISTLYAHMATLDDTALKAYIRYDRLEVTGLV